MDKRIKRFKDCDERFYPYIEKVLVRLPEEAREKILNDDSFTVLSLGRELESWYGVWPAPIVWTT